ncbi:MAG: FkbM family methyltransferase [Pirellulaceae bacterium]
MSNLEATLAKAWQTHQAGDVAAAEQVYRRSIAQTPGHAQAWCYLGLACYDQGRCVEAEQAYRHAIRLLPGFTIAHNNLGNALKLQGRIGEAIASFERALELDPQYINAHFNLGMTCLLAGQEERGWPEFVWRERLPSFAAPQLDAPRWPDGESLTGKTILLWAEQGQGDAIQFVRYARIVKRRAERVVVACPKSLRKLLRTCAGIDQLVALDAVSEVAADIDVHAPLMSLPAMLGAACVTGENAAAYLRPDAELELQWRAWLAERPGYKVGVAWQGNPRHADDRRRSFPLALLEPLAALSGVRLVNLQKGPGSEQVALTGGRVPLLHLEGDVDGASGAFMDTAAIIKGLDLVIAADTAVAHLAAALGTPVWLPLASVPDWRWRLEGDTTPWYESMRLFRQSRPGQWEDVFQRMAAALAQRAGDRLSVPEGPRTENWRRSRRLATSGFNVLKQTRHGPLLYNRNDVYIGRSLEEYGEFSEGEVELFRQLLKPGDVVVEAGANIGAHTAPLAQLVGRDGVVHAFEPQRVVFQTLCANLALGGLANVRARHAALGAAAGSIVVPPLDYDRPNNFGGLGLGGHAEGESVRLMTLDSLEIPHVTLLKADVEGMEAEVLSGAAETIARCKPILYVENDRPEKSAELIRRIAALGYRMYWHRVPLFRPHNFFRNATNVFGGVMSVNMLCLHESVPAQIAGLPPVEIPDSPSA